MTTFHVFMPHWPLSLPPPAAPTLPSRLRHYSSSPLPSSIHPAVPCRRAPRHPSPSSRHCTINCCHHNCAWSQLPLLWRRSVLSIAVELPSRHPLPSRSLWAIHCHRTAPSIIVEETSVAIHYHILPSNALNPSIAVELPSRRPSQSTAHRRWDAVVSSIAVLAIKSSIAVELPTCHPLSIAVQRPSPSRFQLLSFCQLQLSHPSLLRPQSLSLNHVVQLCEYCTLLYCTLLLTWKGGGRLTNKHKWGEEEKKYQLKVKF